MRKILVKCKDAKSVEIAFKRLVKKLGANRILTLRILNFLNTPTKKCLYVLCIYK